MYGLSRIYLNYIDLMYGLSRISKLYNQMYGLSKIS